MYKIIVFKNFEPITYEYETKKEAFKQLKEKWFSPSVWNIALFENDKKLDIKDLLTSWNRPIY